MSVIAQGTGVNPDINTSSDILENTMQFIGGTENQLNTELKSVDEDSKE